MSRRHEPEVFRISGARRGLSEDVRGRERRYVVSMLARTLSVLLTVALWNVSRPLAVVMLALGVVLPYIAVVIANAGRENSPAIPSSLLGAPSRPRLGAGADTPAERPPEPTGERSRQGAGGGPAEPPGRTPGPDGPAAAHGPGAPSNGP
ncbi:DUF3099 domain-containing protein [Streptomyces sp. XM4193]|uniref:DUF3099 domain-containing protein n=1 Tax=Streptomyces sp. XM4193 TaxID=2929782 RepID=UPI001FF9C4F9|nr:DUF3099 domain-containing protein [Streptomyces sp. XM4193]MCK1796539.1 DUF3099 domain-containing protein [Streptomyces sp. XM4193]